MSDHLQSNGTFAKVCDILDKNNSIEIDNLSEIVQELKHTEIKGVENYAQQFQAFLHHFPGVEAPYILAGLKILHDAMLTAEPFVNPRVREKYDKLCGMIEKDTLRVIITQKAKREP